MTYSKKKYTLALIGCGRVANKHAKAFGHLKDELEVLALVDGRLEACQNLNHEHNLGLRDAQMFTSIENFYAANLPVDILAITTPSGSHYALAKEALTRGHHVFIEKPMTLDIEEARDLLTLSQKYSKKIAMGHIYRFFPLVEHIREDIVAGIYGEILSAEVKVHWGHDQAYYDQAPWRGTWAADGGALMNQSIHALDLMVWLLNLKVASVQGSIAQRMHTMEAEDYGAALYIMENGAILSLEGTTITPENAHQASFLIRLEKAEIHAGLKKGKPFIQARDRAGKKVGNYLSRVWEKMRTDGVKRSLRAFLNPHTGIYMDFITALHEDRAPRADGISGVESVENILAVYKSARNAGARVHLPLENFSLEDMQGYFE